MIKLVGATLPESCTTVVAALEMILERAKTGEVVQVAIAYTNSDGRSGNVYATAQRQSLTMLAGGVAVLNARIIEAERDLSK